MMATVLITGANRGLGFEFVRQYAGDDWRVIACCREPEAGDDLHRIASEYPDVAIETLDVTDHQSIDALGARLAGEPVDLLLNNAGVIGPVPVSAHIQKQHFGTIDYALWEQVLRTNTFGPVRMAEVFLDNLRLGGKKTIITLSSTVGSIVERDTPAIAYATSKTAVNKAMTLLASQLKDEGIIVALLCPGYVKTRMDFGTAEIEIEQSVTGMRKLIGKLSLEDSGTFTRFNGERVAW